MTRYPSTHIYDHARGEGWILTATADVDEWEKTSRGHIVPLVLYYTDEQTIETHEVRNENGSPLGTFMRQYLDIGAKLGSYPGASPEPYVEYSEQPRAVRMQRHASDIWRTLNGATGLSETMCVRAAEEFGSTWDEKTADDWQERVKMVGEGRANAIEYEMKREGLIDSMIATR